MLSAIGSFGNHVVNTENTISHRFNRKKVNKLWLFCLFFTNKVPKDII